ncbi:MAG: ABC transporter substrate-binding protein, partial [Rhodospirillaceae bacterium]|nr:ABC transporter substrate-binding protein [Rhodospirillaceae bacterium]
MTSHGLTRRQVLALGGSAAAIAVHPAWATDADANADANADAGFAHGYSPLGALRYPPGFAAFDYVNPAAPKGGQLHLARIGTYDTLDTLVFPGRPPADLRLIYDHLVVQADDEASSFYGLLARGLTVAEDFSEAVFDLDPAARWHDGAPVTADDVVFTFETLKTEGAPFYRQAFLPFTVTADGPGRVRFANTRIGHRDLVRQIATIPIHPAHVWRAARAAGEEPQPLGSGPYRLGSAIMGRQMILERVADYWGAERGAAAGHWNFDRLVFDFYRDETVAMEAFLVGDYDLRFENNPVRWVNGYASPALSSGEVRREATPSVSGHTLHGLVFNQRRPLLADRRVRLALTLAYDFDQVNETLFLGAYAPFSSVFGDSDLAASGSAGADERAILGTAGAGLDPAILDPAILDNPDPLAGLPQPGSRAAFAEAARLLDEAGLQVVDGRRVDPDSGEPLDIQLLTLNPLY